MQTCYLEVESGFYFDVLIYHSSCSEQIGYNVQIMTVYQENTVEPMSPYSFNPLDTLKLQLGLNI